MIPITYENWEPYEAGLNFQGIFKNEKFWVENGETCICR